MANRPVRWAMTASAVFFAATGILLLVAAEELSALLGPEPGNHGLHELLGAAYFAYLTVPVSRSTHDLSGAASRRRPSAIEPTGRTLRDPNPWIAPGRVSPYTRSSSVERTHFRSFSRSRRD